MAVSVRLEPLMEKELELTAKRLGVTKSQFIITALKKALGHQDPYALLLQVEQDSQTRTGDQKMAALYGAENAAPYDTEGSKERLIAKLRAKHGLSPR